MTQAERTDHSLDRKCFVSGGGTSENLDSIDVLRSVNLNGDEQEMKIFFKYLYKKIFNTLPCLGWGNNVFIKE